MLSHHHLRQQTGNLPTVKFAVVPGTLWYILGKLTGHDSSPTVQSTISVQIWNADGLYVLMSSCLGVERMFRDLESPLTLAVATVTFTPNNTIGWANMMIADDGFMIFSIPNQKYERLGFMLACFSHSYLVQVLSYHNWLYTYEQHNCKCAWINKGLLPSDIGWVHHFCHTLVLAFASNA